MLYEWNDLDAALQQLQEGIAQGKSWNSWEALLPGYLSLARVKHAQGDWDGAFAALDEMVALNRGYMPAAPLLADSLRAWLWLRRGHLEAVERWACSVGLKPRQDITYANENDLLLLAQLLIAQNKLPEADRLLERLTASTESGGRWTSHLAAVLLRAVVFDEQDKTREAMQLLALVLQRAEPEGYIRLVVDLGTAVAPLLYQAIEQRLSPDYARRLLAAFPPTDWSPAPERPTLIAQNEDLIEPLSDRELEVLRLIDQGLSNAEIAAKLVLSTGTVKVHTHNVFSKLGVSSRTQAINKARALGLFYSSLRAYRAEPRFLRWSRRTRSNLLLIDTDCFVGLLPHLPRAAGGVAMTARWWFIYPPLYPSYNFCQMQLYPPWVYAMCSKTEERQTHDGPRITSV